MISTLISILFVIILLGVAWWAIQQLVTVIPIAEPFRTLLHVVLVLIAVLIVFWLVSDILGLATPFAGRIR